MPEQALSTTPTADEPNKGYVKKEQTNPKRHKSRAALKKIATANHTKKRKQAKRDAKQAHLASLPRRKIGRPTTYSKQVLEITADYIQNYADHGHKIPSVAGLAVLLKTARETIALWAQEDDKKEFSSMIQLLMAAQEQALTANGLDGTYNSGITKLILSKHGYHDKEQANQGVSITVNVNRDSGSVVIEGEQAE